jgi:hypothetical protein
MTGEHSLWPSLGSLAGVLGGLSILWGALLNWRRQPVEHRLITVQAEVAQATRDKTEAESQSIAFNVVSKALQDADRTIEKLKADRDLLELQLKRETRWRKLNGWPEPPDGKGD